jgi:tetratricopeptide (TPR) repeat protein
MQTPTPSARPSRTPTQWIAVILRPFARTVGRLRWAPAGQQLLHHVMMRIEGRAGNLERARMHAEAVLGVGGESAAAKSTLLNALAAQGKQEEANRRLTRLLDPLPRRPAARIRLLYQAAQIASEAGDTDAARRWAKAVLALAPEHRQSLKLLHRIHVKHLPNDALRAEVFASLQAGGAAAERAAPTAMRIAFHDDQDWRAVIAHAERLPPDDIEATTHRILALARLGEFAAAQAALARARALPPRDQATAPRHDELDLAEANLALMAGNPEQQLACVNQLMARYDLVPIALRRGAAAPIAPARVVSETADAADMGLRVAVIMTIYGRDDEAGLRAAVGSMLAQSYRNLELVLVDDCSPDDTLDLLHELAASDPRVHVFQTPANGGTYRAKNLGIAQTDAELVAFMDSDDWSHPQRLERQVQSLTAHTDAMAVVHNSIRIEPDGWIEFRQQASRFAYISTMLRRTALAELGYFDAVRVSGDAEMIARIRSFYGRQAVRHEPLPTVLMARRAGSLTGGGTHYIGWRSVTGDRWRYHRAFKHWHQRCRADGRTPYVDISPAERPFPAPPSVVGETDAVATERA